MRPIPGDSTDVEKITRGVTLVLCTSPTMQQKLLVAIALSCLFCSVTAVRFFDRRLGILFSFGAWTALSSFDARLTLCFVETL